MPRYRHVAQAEPFLQQRHAGKRLLPLKAGETDGHVWAAGLSDAVAALLSSRPEKSQQAHEQHR